MEEYNRNNKKNGFNNIYKRVQNNLSLKIKQKPNNINVVLIYANNGSGKTRLSRKFSELSFSKILCYNSIFEDDFYWENQILKLKTTSKTFEIIKDEGLQLDISKNFKSFIDLDIESDINTETGNITFDIPNEKEKEIKISRGEESIFIWTVFYTILEKCIEILDEKKEDRSTNFFDNKKIIVIDDPVSSMDDSRIIAVALKISDIMIKSKNKFNYLITTHHPLFFNILFHKSNKTWNKTNYVFMKNGNEYELKKQSSESPFSYHHSIIKEIKYAIDNNILKKYHFNLFRTLLEKTANFLGLKHWNNCLDGIVTNDDFLKLIDHYSHDKLSDLEYNELIFKQVKLYEEIFNKFIDKYFKGES